MLDSALSPIVSTSQVLHDRIVQFTDAGAATGNAVVTFEKDSLSLLAPRGRFDVEMYLSSLKLTGQVRHLHRFAFERIMDRQPPSKHACRETVLCFRESAFPPHIFLLFIREITYRCDTHRQLQFMT